MEEENNEQVEQNEEVQEEQEVSYSQSDVDSQISKAVDKALKNQQAKLEKQKQKEIEDAKAEAEEYAKMSAKEKQEKEFANKLEKFEEEKRAFNKQKLKSQVEDDLKDNGLPADFAGALVNLEDNEEIKERINSLKKSFDEAIENAVNERLKGDTPQVGNTGKERLSVQDLKGLTPEQINKQWEKLKG